MAGGGGGGGGEGPRQLDQTPTWAVSTVCGVIILISIILELIIHKVGEVFERKKKKALFEALEKIKNELMVLGFISLLLTFGQNYIASICVPSRYGHAMSFCGPYDGPSKDDHKKLKKTDHAMRILYSVQRRSLADAPPVNCKKDYVALISLNALHQVHIFIFFLAVFHVIYSAITMMLGRAKIRGWKVWEQEVIHEQEMMNDPSRFRLTHETSFVREHVNSWASNKFFFYVMCFFRQILRSVRKSDYLTMRHGFISVHLAPGMKFDFQKYIKRSLEDDFKVVVGIRPELWAFVMLFLLFDVHGWYVTAVITMIPPLLTLAIGTKLQAIISYMALEIQERHAVIQGMPVVNVSDQHFWFEKPDLVLHMIHFVLFQNAFEITYFFWIWYEFGLRSCFHHHFGLIIIRVCLGVGVQFLCSYITLPLYALVTQMGSTMKRSVFDEQTSKALEQWHKKARKKNEK
ncbi:MLO-like protein 5 [Arabidopsis thaliana]|uniref:MLO-like protein n=1 Tax=Arabidopsis thaliana x Arabidopsis arenosa TaxID=1240361 RepID=A0A8T2GMI3_9BRAS|nr:Mlo-related protein [Arabidopsis thaliana x Arabidopsis arenosa]